ncbi:MAG: hypothetical protein JRH05_07045 [Deltaproteobacteria bacterium]|nr:hypothetical protein [Deltaproteobacteria bacterium]
MKPGSGHLPCKAPLSASRVALVSAGLILILFAAILFSLWMGTADVSMGQLLNLFSGGMEAGDTTRLIVLKIRLPRVLGPWPESCWAWDSRWAFRWPLSEERS